MTKTNFNGRDRNTLRTVLGYLQLCIDENNSLHLLIW